MKPFVKWAGGKTQLLEKLNIVISDEKINRIVEPFVGGGSFFISLNKEFLINDINKELMVTYEIIRDNPKELIKILLEYEKKHSEEYFYNLRNEEPNNNLEKAARLIYLNKACFNGLYRVNSKGKFNVPFGKKEKVKIFDQKNIIELSKLFNKKDSIIRSIDYKEIFKMAKKDDLFFIDPPYDRENKTSFTAYQKDQFLEKEQHELHDEILKLDQKGIRFILTNHNTSLINKLYDKFTIITVNANRMINSNSASRINSTKESIITNIKLDEIKLKELSYSNFIFSMKKTNIHLSDLVCWKKVTDNSLEMEYKLNQLNFLLSNNRSEFFKKLAILYEKDSSNFDILNNLLAIRKKEQNVLTSDNKEINFIGLDKKEFSFIKQIFIESKLIDIFLNKKIKDLKDYILGLEVGSDTNARKNRNGKSYELTVENLLKMHNVKYETQVKYKVNKDMKIFDFVIYLNNEKYLVETNFYNGVGSKLQEVCRSYVNLDKIIKTTKINNQNCKFLWITDGKGWKNNKSLKEAYYEIDLLFNLQIFEEWLQNQLSSSYKLKNKFEFIENKLEQLSI